VGDAKTSEQIGPALVQADPDLYRQGSKAHNITESDWRIPVKRNQPEGDRLLARALHIELASLNAVIVDLLKPIRLLLQIAPVKIV